MSDAMQIAAQRRKGYLNAIAKKEAEIAEMNELIADLDSFIEFGEALVGNQSEPLREVSRPVEVKQADAEDDDANEWDEDEPQQSLERIISQRVG